MRLKTIALLTLTTIPYCATASWVDDWVDNAVYTGADSFQGRERTFLSGGNFAMRNKVKTDYPITISAPRFSSGCGGIDGFMGGFAFLDADYLGDKLQSMITVAPYIAIDMALKSMSKEMSDTLKNAEQIINALNGIQINECQAMKPVVSMAFGEGTGEDVLDSWSEMLNTQAITDNTTRFWNEFNKDTAANNGKAPSGANLMKEVAECPASVTDLFKQGSLIKNVSKATGMESYADLIRGYIGDVKINHATVVQGISIESCANNANSIEGFLFGTGQEKLESGVCQPIGDSLYDYVYDTLVVISDSLEDPNATLPSSAQDLIKRSQLPIISMLSAGIQMGTVDHIRASIAEVVALNYASMATKDFYQNTYESLRRLQQTLKNPSDEGERCNFQVYIQPAELAKDLLEETRQFKKQIDVELTARINQINQNQEFVDQFLRLKHEATKTVTKIKE